MNRFRKLSYTFLRLLTVALVASAAAASFAERVEDLPAPTGYVNDFAHVLSPATVARLDKLAKQLDEEAHAQIAVVTVRNLDGDDSADFATRVFEKYKIGAKGTDRGLLILLAVDDHKWSFKTGYGLEGILPDGKTGDMGRAMVPYLRASDYDGAVTEGFMAAAQVIAADAKVSLDAGGAEQTLDQQDAVAPHRSHSMSVIKLILIIIFIVIVLVVRILRFFIMPMGGWWGGGPWMGGGYGGGGGGGGGGFGGFDGGGTGGGGSDGSW